MYTLPDHWNVVDTRSTATTIANTLAARRCSALGNNQMVETEMTNKELLYAATDRCVCGSGLAYPLDVGAAMKLGAWVCARVLRGEVEKDGHTELPFAFYKVREETSINNSVGLTTRPEGTVCRTVGEACCPKCQEQWESKPYDACGSRHHWFSGPCPACGYAVGGRGSWSSDEGDPIETRYRHVVIAEESWKRDKTERAKG